MLPIYSTLGVRTSPQVDEHSVSAFRKITVQFRAISYLTNSVFSITQIDCKSLSGKNLDLYFFCIARSTTHIISV